MIYKRQMDNIQLIFDATGIVGTPMIFNFTISVGSVHILIKKRQFVCDSFWLSVPEEYNVIIFPDRIVPDIIVADI